jgi:hypothetical protein
MKQTFHSYELCSATLNERYHPLAVLVRGLTFVCEGIKGLDIRKAEAFLLTIELDAKDQSTNYFPDVPALVRVVLPT